MVPSQLSGNENKAALVSHLCGRKSWAQHVPSKQWVVWSFIWYNWTPHLVKKTQLWWSQKKTQGMRQSLSGPWIATVCRMREPKIISGCFDFHSEPDPSVWSRSQATLGKGRFWLAGFGTQMAKYSPVINQYISICNNDWNALRTTSCVSEQACSN